MVTPADGGLCQAVPSLEGPEKEYGLGFLAKHPVKAISRTSPGVGPLVRRRGGAALLPPDETGMLLYPQGVLGEEHDRIRSLAVCAWYSLPNP